MEGEDAIGEEKHTPQPAQPQDPQLPLQSGQEVQEQGPIVDMVLGVWICNLLLVCGGCQ